MRALIDTSTFLWFISGSEKLSVDARRYIADLDNEIFISVVSLWEIAIKKSIGKLELLLPFHRLISEYLEQNTITVLPIEKTHLFKVIDLAFHHRDLFDRMIIAQGLSEQLPVITSDAVFSQYPVQLIW
jgi:PIN domain nuclease of toxin-antitoxin system